MDLSFERHKDWNFHLETSGKMRGHHSILSWWPTGERVTGPGWTQSQPPTSRSKTCSVHDTDAVASSTITLLDSVTTRSRRSTLQHWATATWIWSSRRGRDAARCQCHSLAQFDTVKVSPQTPIWARGPPTALHVLRFLPSTGARHRRLF